MTAVIPLAVVADRRAHAPADLNMNPQRLHRTRRKSRTTPPGAIYVGRPTLWANPFDSARFGHRGAFLLFEDWLSDSMPRRRFLRLGFGDDEIEMLSRRRRALLARIADLRGRNLQCWCPLTVKACHAATLLALANKDHC